MPALTLNQRISNLSPIAFSLYATLAAFSSYTCMYAFRKAFPAATFDGQPGLIGLDYKSAIVIFQVLGYMLSKFMGIKFISEMGSKQRMRTIFLLMAFAEVSLLGFALVPAPYNGIFMLLNGIPLGMIWGLVFSYLEGRKNTEVMGLGLCASFVFASGFVKDIGRGLMNMGVSEFWMPFTTGLVFALPLVLSVFLLNQLPPPTEEDIRLRTKRVPMTGTERKAYFRKFAGGLILLILVYAVLTAYRDFRDNFLADIWVGLQGADKQVNFSATETPVSIGVLLILMLIVLVKDNFNALLVNHLAVALGVLTAGLSTFLHQKGILGDYTWIILTGFGTYIAYIPFNSILFDRMIAAFKQAGNVGFLIYTADSFGYLGSVAVLFYKNYGAKNIGWLSFFVTISYALAILGLIGILFSILYFRNKRKTIEA